MVRAGADEQLGPFGRIKLDGIYADWASNHHLNPRLLASELAATLATFAPLEQPIQTFHACVFSEGRSDRSIQVTHGALVDYFEAASSGRQAATIETSIGPVPAANILIWRKWIERLVDEATARTELATGLAQPANDSWTRSQTVHGAATTNCAPSSYLPGSSPVILKTQQAQLRRDGEKSASEQLDEQQIARQKAEQKIVELSTKLQIQETQNRLLQEELELQRRELNEERRAKREAENESIRMEEQLEQVMGLAEFMNQDNQLSPPDGRLIVQCWCEVTQNGTMVPATGWSSIIIKWFKARGTVLPAVKVRLFVTALTGSDRKKGGAIARANNKG